MFFRISILVIVAFPEKPDRVRRTLPSGLQDFGFFQEWEHLAAVLGRWGVKSPNLAVVPTNY